MKTTKRKVKPIPSYKDVGDDEIDSDGNDDDNKVKDKDHGKRRTSSRAKPAKVPKSNPPSLTMKSAHKTTNITKEMLLNANFNGRKLGPTDHVNLLLDEEDSAIVSTQNIVNQFKKFSVLDESLRSQQLMACGEFSSFLANLNSS